MANITIGRYDTDAFSMNVDARSDWEGYVEDESRTWVLFFAKDGTPCFWANRDESGAVIGEPTTR